MNNVTFLGVFLLGMVLVTIITLVCRLAGWPIWTVAIFAFAIGLGISLIVIGEERR